MPSRRFVLAAIGGAGAMPALAAEARPHHPRHAGHRAFDPVLADLHRRTFRFFWDTTKAENGLAPDNWPRPDFCSIAATGFALTAYCIGVKSGYVSRADAVRRTLVTLRTFWNGPQGPDRAGMMGHKGFFYHFLDMDSGLRFRDTELSSIDTCLFVLGALTAAAFFDGPDADEAEIRKLGVALYERIDWTFMARDNGLISMGWAPEAANAEGHDAGGLILRSWDRYNEGMMVTLLALGSPDHPSPAHGWTSWMQTVDGTWGPNFGKIHLGFSPMFGHQYSHVWFDFRGVADDYMRRHGSDYFTNSRLATEAQRNYAIQNPGGFRDYGAKVWGLTACRGPAEIAARLNGHDVQFHEYGARGPQTGDGESVDDGTLAPTAVCGSIAFAPEICIPAIHALRTRYGADIYGAYGFFDSFNPSFPAGQASRTGHAAPKAGWVANEYLAIDQGPILAMLENYRSNFVWDLFNRSPLTGPIARRAFHKAGFAPTGPAGRWLAA